MIITYFQIKGGSGKSTLSSNHAVHLALQGKDLLYVDGDIQSKTASKWSAERKLEEITPTITAVAKYDGSLAQEAVALNKKYDYVLIDLGAKEDSGYRKTVVISDIVIIPLQPSAPDAWVSETFEVVTQAQAMNEDLRAYIVLNKAPSNPNDDDVLSLTEDLSELEGFTLVKTPIKLRKSFRRSTKVGRGVHELQGQYKDRKAIGELDALFREIHDHE